MPFTLQYETKFEDCIIVIDTLLMKTKYANNLVLTFNNINYLSENNLKYLEISKLNFMIRL